jgi:predicted RNase H-like HicB family nuclease
MAEYLYSSLQRRNEREEPNMKSYVFRVVLEADEDGWRAYIPELEAKGAATWGQDKEEALRNIREVAQMVIESLLEDGEQLPPRITEIDQPVVAVTV